MDKKRIFLGWLGLFLLFTFSCKIGLGAAVDTKAPEISVLYPVADSIIRDAFYLSGKWSDDGEIKGIDVLLKSPDDADGSGQTFNFTGNAKEDGTWSCVINPLDSEKPIDDGTYEIFISITDTYYHVTTCSTLVTIDNTPPIVVLQRPSSKIGVAAEDYDSYGQSFTLEGQAADDNNVELIQVDFYSDEACTNLIHSVSKANVPSTILLDVATFVEGVQNDYALIYGSTSKNGPKNVYCTITAYDGSQRFPSDGAVQSEADLKGNAATSYYLYDVVSTEILSKYKITEVYHMLNGSYVADDATRTAENSKAVVEVLSKNAVSRGVFSLNPANNPYFTVAGREFLKKDGTDFSAPESFITNDSNLVVEVSPGLDGILLDVDSIKIYFIECDDNAVILPGAQKIYPVTSKSRSGNSYKYVVSVDASCGISVGSKYIIGVDGTDNQKNCVVASGNGYGFLLSANGSAPILSVTTPTSGKTYLKKGDDFTTAGSVYFAEGVPKLEIKCNGKVVKTITDVADYTVDPAVPNKFVFNYVVPNTEFDQSKSNSYEIEFVASKDNLTTSKTKEVEYDVLPPVISFDSVTPIAQNFYDLGVLASEGKTKLLELVEYETPDNNKYLNKEFGFKVSFDDDDKIDSETTKYAIYKGKYTDENDLSLMNPTPMVSGTINPSSKDAIKVNSSSWTGGEITFVIEAKDKAGNRSVHFENGYIVEQNTDIPVIIPPSGCSFDVATISDSDGKNQYEKSWKFNIRCVDDDGIKSIEINKGSNSGNLTFDKSKDYSATNPKEINYEYVLPDNDGIYYFRIKVTDKMDISRETAVFAIKIKKSISFPVISKIESKSTVSGCPEYINGINENTFTNTIKITSGTPPYTVYRCLREDIDEEKLGIDIDYMKYMTSTNPPIIKEIGSDITVAAIDEGEDLKPVIDTTYYYVVRDSGDNGGLVSNIMSVTCKVDCNPPENLAISTPNDKKIGIDAISDSSFIFAGSAADKDSGVVKIWYSFTNTGSAPTNENDWKEVLSSNGSWSFTKYLNNGKAAENSVVTNGNLTEGSWTLYVKAEDAVGNVTSPISRNFDVDLFVPTITDLSTISQYVNDKFTLSGTATDTNGIKQIQVSDGTFSKDVDLTNNYDKTTGAWSIEIEVGSGEKQLSEGNHNLKLLAKDNMEKSTYINRTVFVDITKPAIDTSKIKIPGSADFDSDNVEFKGSASDISGSGVKEVEICVADNEDLSSTTTKKTAWGTATGDTNWNYVLDLTSNEAKAVFNEEGTKYIFVRATDNAGNVSDEQKISFLYDKAAPTLSDFAYNVGGDDIPLTEDGLSIPLGTENFTIKGKFADTCSTVNVVAKQNGVTVTPTYTANQNSGDWNLPVENLTDGTYKFTFTAKDSSGRTSDNQTVTFRVDTIQPEVVSITSPTPTETENSVFTFKGTASDNSGGTGVEKIYVGFTERASGASDWSGFKEAFGTTNWSCPIDINDNTSGWDWTSEGEKTVYVYAVDAVGNISDKESESFVYDTAKPVVSAQLDGVNPENSNPNKYITGSLYNLKVTASDTYGINKVVVTESKDGGTPADVSFIEGTEWSTEQLPLAANRENGKPKSGTYTYEVYAKDKAGKESSKIIITVSIDVDAPTITISKPLPPDATGAVPASGDKSLSGSDYTFGGSISDVGTSGLALYKYQILESTEPAPTDKNASEWISESVLSSDSWNLYKNLASGKTPASPAANTIYEGHYKLYIFAQDNAGNQSDIVWTEFFVDQGAPEIEGVSYQIGSNTPVAMTKDGIDYLNSSESSVKLLGKATDSYKVKEVKINNENVTVNADSSWSKDVTLTTNSEIICTITAQDDAGRTTTEKYSLYCDKTPPTIEITSPDKDISGNDSLNGSTYTFRFSVNDEGSGIKEYKYLFTDTQMTAAQIITAATDVNAQANGWKKQTGDNSKETFSFENGKTPASPAANTIYEGMHYIHMYGIDNSGNESTLTRTYWVDKAAPTLTEINVPISGVTLDARGKLTLSGTVCDVNKIVSLIIKDNATANEWNVTLSDDCDDTLNPTTWKQDIELGSGTDKLNDGNHTLTIIAKDGAEKESQLTRTVIVDTKEPTATGVTVTTTQNYTDKSSNNWFKNSTVEIKVTGVQDSADSSTSFKTGIATVQYTTDTGENSSWIPLQKGTENGDVADWNASVYCPNQGLNTIRIQILDNAGNKKEDLSKNVYIDTERPALPSSTDYKVDGIEGVTGSKLINGRKTVKINLSAADGIKNGLDSSSTSGLKQIVYKDYTYTCTDAGPYEFEIPVANLEAGQVKFEIFDNVGNTQDWIPFSFIKDETAPSVKIVSPSDSDSIAAGIQVNGSFTLEGSAKESGGAELESIDLCYYENSTNGWQHLAHLAGESTWSYDIDTSTFTDGSAVTICAIVTDTAGNRNLDTKTGTTVTDNTVLVAGSTENRVPTISPDQILNDTTNGKINKISIVVDQDSDRPVIKFSTIDLNGDANGTIWLKNQTKIVGSVTDDDGIDVSSFKISLSDSSTESDWKSIVVDGTSWSFDVADFFTGTDEEKEKAANKLINLYFKVKDVKGREFKSKAVNATCNESTYSTIKLQSGTATVTTKGLLNTDKTTIATSTVLPLTIDTLPPTVEILGGKVNVSDEYNSSISSLKYGGTKTSFYLKVKAGDGQNQLKSTNGIIGTATFNLLAENIIVPATVTPEANDEYILTFELTESQLTKIKSEEYNDTVEVKIVAEDKAGNKSNQTANINADFKNPVVTLSSPDNSQLLSGSVMAYGSIDSTATMYYSLSLDDTTEPGIDEDHKGNVITSWKDDKGNQHNNVSVQPYYKPIVGNSFQWYIYFDGKFTEEDKTHDILLKDYLISYGITTINEINTFKSIVTFYLWIKAVDESGNQSVEKYILYVDPQGDAPKITIEYPKEDGSILGGNITLRGTAADTIGSNIGIKNVWLQIISAKHNGYESSNANQLNITKGGLTFSDKVTQINDAYSHSYTIEDFKPKGKDVRQWIEKGYAVYTDIENSEPTQVTNAPADTADADKYYIKATVSGSSWNLSINKNHEFDPEQGKLNLVAYRAFSQDNDGNLSRQQQQFAIFDSDTPIFSNIYLRQYSNNDAGTGDVIASRPYEADMWVKGKWWIYGSVQDTQGIESLKINNVEQTGINGGEGVEEIFNFPLSTDTGVGSFSIRIEAEDKASSRHTGVFDGTVNYDNNKPELITSGTTYKINELIQNSNGFYMFSSQVRENAINTKPQSGFDYLAFWFERNNTGKHVVYDVMRKQTDREIAWNDLNESEGLMWKTKTVTRSETSLGVITLDSEDSNIHVGGLCKIGGSIYKISSVSGSVIGINGQPELPTGYSTSNNTQTAYFAMANIVDNSIESATGDKSYVDGRYGYYSTISNDDGDYMVESVQKSGTNWTWEANINSQNIPDGGIILHYVAFDKAGNYEVGSVNANVANNAPRLASLKVWTDFDEDGIEDDGESETKFCLRKTRTINKLTKSVATDVTSKLIVSGNDKDYDSAEPGTSFMSITAATKFIPEIIGGNGDLYYSRKIGTAANVKNATSNYGTSSFGKGHDDGIDEEVDNNGYKILDDEGSDYIQGHTGYLKNPTDTQETLYVLEVMNSDLEKLNNGLTWFNYTIYDSTEGCSTWDSTANGTAGRLTAEFHVALNVLYKDEVAPTVNFIPLYWKSSTENSVYIDVNENKYGHVELKDDLGSTSLGSTYGTNDDKVSGIVVFRGTAFDNKKLKQLNWQILAENGTTQLLTGTIPAVYSGNTWSCGATLQDNHYTFTVISSPDTSKGITKDDVFFNGSGHQVRWELVVDTSYITGVVAQNTKVVVTATDYSSTTGRTGNSNYQVDILPYITGLTSRLDEPRSSNGHYQLADDETSVMLQGYNLSRGNGSVDISSIMSSQASGQYDYTIPGTTITTINNINNNSAHGEYDITTPGLSRAKKAANMYNYQPTSTNASLTDDVIFDMWQFNSQAAKTNSGYGFVQKPIMKYNPINGNLSFAFSNGADKFSMANGTSTSYTLWEMNYASYVANAFTIDQLGRSHGISVGIDTAPDSGKAGRMNYFYSGWGQSTTDKTDGNFYWKNNLHIDTIGLPNPSNYSSNTPMNGLWNNSVIMEERFKGTTIVAANHGTENYPTVYIAYYDNICNRIVFRYGTITGGQNTRSDNNKYYPGGAITYDQLITTEQQKVSFALQDGQYSLIAGNDAQGNHLTPYEPGEYVCLTVIPGTTKDDDVVCIVWYDAMNKNLMYSYKKAPCNSNFASTTTGDGYWSTAKVLKENCGEYCKIVADGNGGIHIAAYDRNEKGIVYVYLPTYDASYTESDNLFYVDTFNGPFDEINIDVAVDADGNACPAISYYANGTPKLATYSAGISSMPEKSIEEESFTGNWDVCFVPTPSSLLKDHINVAMPKNSSGILGHIETTSLFDGTVGTTDGTVSGNTTDNPILAYAIRNGAIGYMEIAQRK